MSNMTIATCAYHTLQCICYYATKRSQPLKEWTHMGNEISQLFTNW